MGNYKYSILKIKNKRVVKHPRETFHIVIPQQKIDTSSIILTSHNQNENKGKVDVLQFTNCRMTQIPEMPTLTELFPNVTVLDVFNSNLATIDCNHLKHFSFLKELYLAYNKIQYLQASLFQYTPNLETISFQRNPITNIEDGILVPLRNLQYFNLLGNPTEEILFDTINKKGDVTLDEFKLKLRNFIPRETLWKAIENARKKIVELKVNDGKSKDVQKAQNDARKELARLKIEFGNELFIQTTLNTELKENIALMKMKYDKEIERLKEALKEGSPKKVVLELKETIKKLEDEIALYNSHLEESIAKNKIVKDVIEAMKVQHQEKIDQLTKEKEKLEQAQLVKILGADTTVTIEGRKYTFHKAVMDRFNNTDFWKDFLDAKQFEDILRFVYFNFLPDDPQELLQLCITSRSIKNEEFTGGIVNKLKEYLNKENSYNLAINILNCNQSYDDLKIPAFEKFKENFKIEMPELTPDFASKPWILQQLLRLKDELEGILALAKEADTS